MIIKHWSEDFKLYVLHAGFDVPGTSSGGHMKSSIKEQPRAGGNMKKSVHFLSESPSDTGPTKKRKILPSSGIGTITKQHLGPSVSYKFSEVTRRPGMVSYYSMLSCIFHAYIYIFLEILLS